MTIFPAGHILTSADFDTLFPEGIGAWTPYTPTITQSNTPTFTTIRAAYTKSGRTISASGLVTISANGTANNEIRVSLPETAAHSASIPIGNAWLYDASAGALYRCQAISDNTGYFTMFATHVTTLQRLGATSSPFTAALANTDQLAWYINYESAS